MRHINGIAVFFDDDLPNMASHCDQWECGYSLHRGVLVQWDEDHDVRILEFIDGLPEDVHPELLVAQEHEASLSLLWKDRPAARYAVGNTVDLHDDTWYIERSEGPDDAGVNA
ncbi:MAG TPA: hypothetical protein PLU30_21710 [Verrucomicrobiae bacterium]|nr:hypothetical protein [Verrucomicrobiae bacterium]